MSSSSLQSSSAIRMEARQHLRKLRQARLQSKIARTPGPPTEENTQSVPLVGGEVPIEEHDAHAANEAIEPRVEETFASQRAGSVFIQLQADEVPESEGKSTDQSVEDMPSEKPSAGASEELESDPSAVFLDEPGDTDVADAERSDSGEETDETSVEHSEAPSKEVAISIREPGESELFALPGSGPGLVWMLEKSGISDLKALAEADVEKLRTDLGLIAKILDVDYWIEFARKSQEEA